VAETAQLLALGRLGTLALVTAVLVFLIAVEAGGGARYSWAIRGTTDSPATCWTPLVASARWPWSEAWTLTPTYVAAVGVSLEASRAMQEAAHWHTFTFDGVDRSWRARRHHRKLARAGLTAFCIKFIAKLAVLSASLFHGARCWPLWFLLTFAQVAPASVFFEAELTVHTAHCGRASMFLFTTFADITTSNVFFKAIFTVHHAHHIRTEIRLIITRTDITAFRILLESIFAKHGTHNRRADLVLFTFAYRASIVILVKA
jgi:hypothetical protein